MIGRTNSGGAGDPSIPVGTGQHLVTFYDFDGKVLKRQRVATGGDATAPTTPTHEFLTFAEWNNPFTNVQSDIDTGAIYNTTDGKTYLFITLIPVTGLAPTLYFSKSSTSLMTIDWGDGTTSTSTTSGNQSINHVYATAGDYIITVDNSAGGTWTLGKSYSDGLFKGYLSSIIRLYVGSNCIVGNYCLMNCRSLEVISINGQGEAGTPFSGCKVLRHLNLKTAIGTTFGGTSTFSRTFPLTITAIPDNAFNSALNIKKLIFGNTLLTIGANAFYAVVGIETLYYIFLSTTPPTLANINAFSGINPICKIYVPDASVEAYKAATNWNNFSAYIYPLSSKPQSDE